MCPLSPLFPVVADGTILFVNEVVTFGSDLFELIHHHRLRNQMQSRIRIGSFAMVNLIRCSYEVSG